MLPRRTPVVNAPRRRRYAEKMERMTGFELRDSRLGSRCPTTGYIRSCRCTRLYDHYTHPVAISRKKYVSDIRVCHHSQSVASPDAPTRAARVRSGHPEGTRRPNLPTDEAHRLPVCLVPERIRPGWCLTGEHPPSGTQFIARPIGYGRRHASQRQYYLTGRRAAPAPPQASGARRRTTHRR